MEISTATKQTSDDVEDLSSICQLTTNEEEKEEEEEE